MIVDHGHVHPASVSSERFHKFCKFYKKTYITVEAEQNKAFNSTADHKGPTLSHSARLCRSLAGS